MEGLTQWAIVHQEFTCEHNDTHLVRYIKSNGVVCVRIQCKTCGHSVKEVSKRGLDADSLPLFDDGLRQQWQDRRRQRSDELFQQRQQEQQDKSRQWWIDYSRYLKSERWHKMRQRVLERDNHLCQSCLKNKAAQIHHLSYELYNQIGASAAFELIAICMPCHHLIHPGMAAAQQNVIENSQNPYIGAIPQWMPE